jgi:ABC-type multidrug transport system fused ATPase/permease subunit
MYSHLLDQEIAFFDRNRTGDLLNRLSSDTVIVQKSLTNNISTGLRSIFMVRFCYSLLFGKPQCRQNDIFYVFLFLNTIPT